METNYSQWAGEKTDSKGRHEEPTPDWHSCDVACAGVEE